MQSWRICGISQYLEMTAGVDWITPPDYDPRYSLPLFAAGTLVLSAVYTGLLRQIPSLRDRVLWCA